MTTPIETLSKDEVDGLPLEAIEYSRVTVDEASYEVGFLGSGPPVLLLHGFPETHQCWHQVADRLSHDCTVVVTDLRGYGASRAPAGGGSGEGFDKRTMAADLVTVMRAFGHERFAVVGHDRGGRVAYRMALDHSEVVTRVGVLNIVPTVDQFDRMAEGAALEYYPWFFLAQPAPFAETLINASAEYFLTHTLDSWSADPAAITPAARAHYLRAFTPATVAAMCADYRAAFHLDRVLDAADREADRRIECPVLVHWGAGEDVMSDGESPIDTWRAWADAVEGGPLVSGHFIPEEAAAELSRSLAGFLATSPG
jgi:haloacetate dehalogenase